VVERVQRGEQDRRETAGGDGGDDDGKPSRHRQTNTTCKKFTAETDARRTTRQVHDDSSHEASSSPDLHAPSKPDSLLEDCPSAANTAPHEPPFPQASATSSKDKKTKAGTGSTGGSQTKPIIHPPPAKRQRQEQDPVDVVGVPSAVVGDKPAKKEAMVARPSTKSKPVQTEKPVKDNKKKKKKKNAIDDMFAGFS